jgi:hypothetical protein
MKTTLLLSRTVTLIVIGATMIGTMLAQVASSRPIQASDQPDPAVVRRNVQAIREALRDMDARIQQAARRDASTPGSPNSIGSDAEKVKAELETISKALKTLDQRVERVLSLDALKSSDSKSQSRRDFRPVTIEMDAVAKQFSECVGHVNKIDAIVVKQSTKRASQPLVSDLDFIKRLANDTQTAMKRVLSGAGGASGGFATP